MAGLLRTKKHVLYYFITIKKIVTIVRTIEAMQKKISQGQTNMKSTNKKLTLDAQNFGYLNI